jgi:SpoVK/Ycf46/Vps4 family AAA+-type ATPase
MIGKHIIVFFVKKVSGTIGEDKQQYKNRDGEADSLSSVRNIPAEISSESIDKYSATPLKWKPEELSMPKKESAVNDLSLKKEHTDFVHDAVLWRNSEKWFKDRLIPWKRGLLLYGCTGTGKTAFVRALGQELNMPIICFDL